MAQDPTDPNTPPPADDPALGSLQARLEAARRAEDERLARDHVPLASQARAGGAQIASTMIGYPLGGIAIGWVLDGLFDTRPAITIGLMFAAFIAACVQVLRSNQNGSN